MNSHKQSRSFLLNSSRNVCCYSKKMNLTFLCISSRGASNCALYHIYLLFTAHTNGFAVRIGANREKLSSSFSFCKAAKVSIYWTVIYNSSTCLQRLGACGHVMWEAGNEFDPAGGLPGYTFGMQSRKTVIYSSFSTAVDLSRNGVILT